MEVSCSSGVVIPGERLGSSVEYQAGNGVYLRNGFLYASVVGQKSISTEESGQILSILRDQKQEIVPKVGSIVTCKVRMISLRFCKVDILSSNGVTLKGNFQGTVRKEDIRATEIDKVEIYKCFRPGDIIAARVISLGDAHSYLLSTAENELGVIFAKSEAGDQMIPYSWQEMMCSETKMKEFRKVARTATCK